MFSFSFLNLQLQTDKGRSRVLIRLVISDAPRKKKDKVLSPGLFQINLIGFLAETQQIVRVKQRERHIGGERSS